MGDIRNARCLFLQVSWNQYGDQRVDPIRRSLTGSITPIMTWILYADHDLDPICRSSSGSIVPVTDTRQPGKVNPQPSNQPPLPPFQCGQLPFQASLSRWRAPSVIDRHYGATADRRNGASLKL